MGVSEHLLRATGFQSFKHVILFLFDMGTMVDFLKHGGTTDRERERLKMSVKTPASWNAHARSTWPGWHPDPQPCGYSPVGRIRLHPRQKMESALTSSAAAVGALSLWAVL